MLYESFITMIAGSILLVLVPPPQICSRVQLVSPDGISARCLNNSTDTVTTSCIGIDLQESLPNDIISHIVSIPNLDGEVGGHGVVEDQNVIPVRLLPSFVAVIGLLPLPCTTDNNVGILDNQ